MGWNLKFRKGGRSLCTVYPRKGYFTVLVVVGRREKERAEALLPQLSEGLRAVYERSYEGNGQRWMMIDLSREDEDFRGVQALIQLRRESR